MPTLPRTLALCTLAALLVPAAAAQKSAQPPPEAQPQAPVMTAADLAAKVPAPKPEDVRSLDAIMHAGYDVISGPAGTRDWTRFRSLFLPTARFTEVGKGPDGSPFVITWSVEEFVRDAGIVFSRESFYENAIVNQPDTFGGMTQVLSSYESRHNPGEKPFQRGVNSFQLLNDGKRWWIVSIFWDSERSDNPLPAKLAGKP
jgi:hypothetical protein